MKVNLINKFLVSFLFLSFWNLANTQTCTPTSTTGSGTVGSPFVVTFSNVTTGCNWVVPTDVTSITVECWGGGGAGGGVSLTGSSTACQGSGGGGKGGMYSKLVMPVSAGSTLKIAVGGGGAGSTGAGGDGGNSWVSTTTSSPWSTTPATGAWALGGKGGSTPAVNGGNISAVNTSYTAPNLPNNVPGTFGIDKFHGGDGMKTANTSSRQGGGGGGGGGGSSANGAAASGDFTGAASSMNSQSTGGAGGAGAGGVGGAGAYRVGSSGIATNAPTGAAVYGGAGGGALALRNSSTTRTATGASGAQGLVRITYIVPTCTNPTDAGTIDGIQTNCGGFDPAAITSSTAASGHSGILEYKWQQSTTNGTSEAGFADITSTNSDTYDPPPITQTTWYRRLARVSCVTDGWTTAVKTTAIEKTVEPVQTASSGSAISLCQGLTTVALNGSVGGSATTGIWSTSSGGTFANNTGTTPSTATWTPPAGFSGAALLTLTSGGGCGTAVAANKNVTVNANPSLVANSTLTRSPTGPQFTGTTINFTAAPTGGTSPYTYAWTATAPNAFFAATPSSGTSNTFSPVLTNTNAYSVSPLTPTPTLFSIQCTVTDNLGCTATAALAPSIYPAIQDIQGTLTRCSGAGTTLLTTNTSMPLLPASTTTSYNEFVWSISPSSAGTIVGTMAGLIGEGLITWNPAYYGSATVSVYAKGAGNSLSPVPGTLHSAVKTATVVVTPTPSATMTTPGAAIDLCHGNTYTLGGNVIASGAWTLTLSDGSTVTGTGVGPWSKTITPTATATYAISSLTNAAGCATGTLTGSTTLTLPTVTTALAPTSTATCVVNGTNWIHFYDAAGKLIVSINPHGNNLGSVTAESYVDGAPIVTQACGSTNPQHATAVMARRWHITPTNNQAAYIRFPYASGELSDLVTASAATTANALDNVSSVSSLKLSKYSGINQDGNWANNCADGGTVLIPSQMGNGAITTANDFVSNISGEYVQFSVPGFSEFWLHNSNNPSALPVELTSLSASCDVTNEVVVNWTTASEHNAYKYIVEKSRDMIIWEVAGEVAAAGNSNSDVNYTSIDANPFNGVSYYRLVQVDNDGSQEFFGPISVPCSGENEMIVFPNPSNGSFTVEIISSEILANAKAELADVSGKVISSREVSVMDGKTQILFDGMNLESGAYIVRIVSENKIKPVKIIVQ